MKMFLHSQARVVALSTVEQLTLNFTTLPRPPHACLWSNATRNEVDLAKEQLALSDSHLSQALTLELFPGLAYLDVHFSEVYYKYFFNESEYECG